MALSVREIKCAHNSASEETEHVCDWCQSIIDFQPQKGWNVSLSPEEHERAMTLFGGPDGTSKRKWQTLQLMTRDMPDVQWARLPADIDPIVQPPESWSAFEALVAAVARGDRLTHQHENMLREGIVFYDGSTLRFLDSAWNLNGVHLPGLSLSVVFALLGEPEKRRGWDIPGLLVGAVSVNPDTGQAEPAHATLSHRSSARTSTGVSSVGEHAGVALKSTQSGPYTEDGLLRIRPDDGLVARHPNVHV